VLLLLVAAGGYLFLRERQGNVTVSHDAPAPPVTGTFAAGRRYDDLEKGIEYTGSWWHDHQFPQSSGQSLTYSEKQGDGFRIAFTGTAITYVFTKAANRGIADVRIDGGASVRINQYSSQTKWQETQRFGELSPGSHTLEVRVSGDKDPASAGIFVDLDAFEVGP